ncbi:MAG TPA: hypothetical protein PK504_12695 [Ferruginibacter sp.]|nr:hypothetical protein [Ferruginibacter sp.]HRE64863.1 hypothetical protein [Ferruginibacter sp.]
MVTKDFSTYTNEALLTEAKKIKSAKIYDAVFLGVLIGIAVYSSVKNRLGLLSFIPLLYLPVAAKNNSNRTALEKELKARGLNKTK